jgi:chromosome segregation ATPase
LERSLREKEATITSLRSDIKATRLKEMEIEKETYYEEILRLQRVAEGLQMEMDEQVPMSKKQLHERVTELEKVLGEVVSRYEKVKKDRDKLREVLDHWEENGVSYPANDEKASKYMTLTQGAAVSALVQMDLTLTDKMERINFLEQNLELQKKDNEALSNDMQECNNENERQIKQLTDLKEKSSNIEQMCIKYKKDLEQTQENLTLELAAHERTKGTLKCLQEELENELVAREFFQKMNKKRTQKLLSSKQQISTAATIIQYRWRLYKSYKRQKEYDCQQAESIIKIQNILRAHNVRIAVLSNQKSHLVKTKSLQSCDHSNTVNVIQTLNCVLLGHVTRKVFLTNK